MKNYVLHLKYLFEVNIFTLSRKNIFLIIIAIFVIYFFMTQILLYDLYDLPKNEAGELTNRSYETNEYKSRK